MVLRTFLSTIGLYSAVYMYIVSFVTLFGIPKAHEQPP